MVGENSLTSLLAEARSAYAGILVTQRVDFEFLPLFFPFFPFHFLPLLYLLFPALSHSSPSHFPYFPTPFPSAEGGIGLLVLPVLQRLGDA